MSFRIVSWFLIAFACFYGIGSYPLLDNNEGLYASIARDMLETGRYVIPHLNGVAYAEKPPMLYWLMAGSMALFGENESAVHLVPALAYFLTIVSLERFTRRITGNETVGLSAALMLATSLPLLIWGREILCDMIMTCFFSCAMWYFYQWQQRSNTKHLVAFYALIALAVLTKGLVAIVLAGGTVILFYLWERKPWRQGMKLLSPLGIMIFLLIAAPWHILAFLQEPDFGWFYFINEQFMRFINKREPHDYHTGHFWYYLPRILVYLFPWTLFTLIFTRNPKTAAPADVALRRFLWSWFSVCLVFFSIAGSKANYYMIIGMPPLVMLIILQLKPYMVPGRRVARSLASGGLLMVLIILCFLHAFCGENSGELFTTCQNITWSSIIAAALYCIVAIALCWRVPQHWLFPILGSYILLLLPLAIAGANTASEKVSQKDAALYLQDYPEVAVYQEFENVSALAFYLKKPLLIVDSQSSDLLYGRKQLSGSSPDARLFLTASQWAGRTPRTPMVVLNNHLYAATDTLYKLHVNLKHVCIKKRFERVTVLEICGHER